LRYAGYTHFDHRPIIEITDAVTVCDNALPYVWNGNEYFTEDTYTVTLEGQDGDCDTLATLILTIVPSSRHG
jgi:hypothetical protein